MLVASCTSSGDPNLGLGVNGYNSAAMVAPQPGVAGDVTVDDAGKGAGASSAGARHEPPAANPKVANSAGKPPGESAQGAAAAAPDAAARKQVEAVSAKQAARDKQTAEASAAKPPAAGASQADAKAAAGEAQVIATAAEWPAGEKPAQKKKGFLAAFFGSTPASAASSPAIVQEPGSAPAVARQPAKTFIENRPAGTVREEKPVKAVAVRSASKPVLDSEATRKRRPVVLASYGGENSNGLPGVRTTALFEIKRKSGIDDDSDIDLHEEEGGGSMMLASAAGMARLAPNGLLKQTHQVDVACLKPSLVRVLKTIERRFGKKLVVTSGYRSRAYNMSVRGAKNSQHMYCAAADIQVPGVSKWELANFARSMSGRGGVGTYCHTNSVHVDIGPERDWNWRCSRRG
jgi:uncharacterized protein YcbK (DUF882 family)